MILWDSFHRHLIAWDLTSGGGGGVGCPGRQGWPPCLPRWLSPGEKQVCSLSLSVPDSGVDAGRASTPGVTLLWASGGPGRLPQDLTQVPHLQCASGTAPAQPLSPAQACAPTHLPCAITSAAF